MGYLSCQAPRHEDIADLVALDQRALGGLWSAEGYGREIDSPNSCLLMLVHKLYGNKEDPANLSIAPMPSGATPSGADSPIFPDLAPTALAESSGWAEADTFSILGIGCYWAILDEAHITVLAVDPRYQQRGLGKWLLINLLVDACDRALTRATLEVRPSNSRALALYDSFGFEALGQRRRYYADGEDALILWQNSLKTAEFRDRLHRRHQATCDRLQRQGWQIIDEKKSVNRT